MQYRLRTLLGYVVGPAIWLPFFGIMAYGLWLHEWYGYMMVAVFATLVITLLSVLYWIHRLSDAELERIARRHFAESDD